MRAFVLTATLLTSVTALAGDESPQVRVDDDGTIIGRMVVDAPAAEIRRALGDIQHSASTSDVLSIDVVRDGSCSAITRTTRGLWTPLKMQTKLCPTATGWREHLVSSTDFNAYEIEWVVTDGATGSSDVQLRVRSEVNLAVPEGLLRSGKIRGVRNTFAAMLARLLSPKSD